MKNFKQKNSLYFDFLDEEYRDFDEEVYDLALLIDENDVEAEIKGEHTVLFIVNLSEFKIVDTKIYQKSLIRLRDMIIDEILEKER